MFDIMGMGTILMSLALTVGAIYAAVVLGPRLKLDDRAILGIVGRLGLVCVASFMGLLTFLLMFNRAMGTVTSFSDIPAFFYLLGYGQ